MKRSVIGISLILVSMSQSFIASAQSGLPLKIVQPKDFCQRVTNTMTTLGTQQGMDRRESMRLGGKASSTILDQLKSGKMDPYMDAASLKTSPSAEGDRMWFSIPEVLISSMGIAPKSLIFIDSVSDLRFTSHTQPGSQILLLASGLGDLTPERAKLVAKTAQSLGIQMSIIWVGKGREGKDVRSAQGLAFITSLTGGAFLDLSAHSACSGT